MAEQLFWIIVIIIVCICWRIITPYHYEGGHVKKNLKMYPRTKAEAAAIKILEELTQESFPTVNPPWLKRHGKTLELDGYNDKLKLALEFSGPLHTKWYPTIEPYEKYYERLVRDTIKRKLCAANGVNLIVIDMSLPTIHWHRYIASRLYDFGILKNQPANYLEETVAEPYRNPYLEEELGLAEL